MISDTWGFAKTKLYARSFDKPCRAVGIGHSLALYIRGLGALNRMQLTGNRISKLWGSKGLGLGIAGVGMSAGSDWFLQLTYLRVRIWGNNCILGKWVYFIYFCKLVQ